jgi:hypothetical protein
MELISRNSYKQNSVFLVTYISLVNTKNVIFIRICLTVKILRNSNSIFLQSFLMNDKIMLREIYFP